MFNEMSFSFRERSNPPSRRKSCSACIRAKRRCDGATPACLRCGHRGIPCDYPQRKARRAALTKESEASATRDLVTEPLGLVDHPSLEDNVPPVMVADLNDGLQGPESFNFSLDPAALSLELVHQPLTVLPPQLTPTSLGSAAEVISKQLQFALDETQRAIYTMAAEMQTPWSHPMLYQDDMPNSIRDAHASCALYTLKTKSNAPFILRSIDSYVNTLLTSDPDRFPPLQSRLAHTQSLILYHIIRLLDGDIRARASAERQLPTLEDSAFALLAYVNFDEVIPNTFTKDKDTLPLYPIGPAKAAWREWILHESARRTFLFALYFIQAYRIIAGSEPPHCDGRLTLCRLLTVSAGLWEAKDAVSFARAWNQRRFYVIRDCTFDGILREGRAEDVDAFGRMLMSSAMGIEEAEGWFASRGLNLRGGR